MEDVKLRLDAWRDEERRRDALALGSAERKEAEEDVRRARTVFHAEVAQVAARYAEAEYRARNSWSLQWDRRTSRAGDPPAVASLARWPQR